MPVPQRHHSVRRSYDAVAEEYAARFDDELTQKPFDRALLAALCEEAGTGALVADIGCGPGQVGAWLQAQGLRAVGIDLSPGMLKVGQRLHPELDFRQGDFLALPAADSEFAALVAFYSIIHLLPEEIGPAFGECHRVLRPGGLFLVAFHVGDGVVHEDEWHGHEVDVDFRFLQPDAVTRSLESAGFCLEVTAERTPYPAESTRRAYLLSRRR